MNTTAYSIRPQATTIAEIGGEAPIRLLADMIAGVEGIHPAHAFNRVVLAFEMVQQSRRTGIPLEKLRGVHHASNPSAATVALAERIAKM